MFETTNLPLAHKSIFIWNLGEPGLLAWQSAGRLDTLPSHWSFDNSRTNLSISWNHFSLLILPVMVVDCAKRNVGPGSQTALLSKLINLWAGSGTSLRICFLVVAQGSSIDFRQLCHLIIVRSLEKCRSDNEGKEKRFYLFNVLESCSLLFFFALPRSKATGVLLKTQR